MGREGRRSIGSGGGSNGDISSQLPDMGRRDSEDLKGSKFTKIARVLTVLAYVIAVSTGAVLLSAYYIILWVPHPSDPITRPTDPPYSLAQHGNSHFSGGSYYHYPKVSQKNSMDATRHLPPSRNKKNHYKTTLPPNLLPKPQYLIRRKATPRPYPTSPPA